MKIARLITLLYIAIALSGCVSMKEFELTEDGKKLKSVNSDFLADNCEFIDVVEGWVPHMMGQGSMKLALNKARNKAAKLGANAFHIENLVNEPYSSNGMQKCCHYTALIQALKCDFK